MKSFPSEAMDAIVAGEAIVTGAVAILCVEPVFVWGGPSVLPLDGDDYLGLDDRGTAQRSEGALGGSAGRIDLRLSGIDAAALELLDADELRQAPAIIRRLIFDGAGKTLLGHHVFNRGRCDEIATVDVIGGAAVITVSVDDAARGLGRSGQRMRADADQRLIRADDGYFRNTAYAGEKMLYWGGKRPARAGFVLTSNPPGYGFGTTGGGGGGVPSVGPFTDETGMFWSG